MGEREGTLIDALTEQTSTIVENELVRYVGGGIVGGAVGDVIRDVFSGLIVEAIVNVFFTLGIEEVVLTPIEAEPCPTCEYAPNVGYVVSPFVKTIGAFSAVAVLVVVIWKYIYPRLGSRSQSDRRAVILRILTVSVTLGIVAGAVVGLLGAILVSIAGVVIVAQTTS